MKKGFTLIELLVVVLIIGILSAIALPQYQKAVIKSRVATILPILKSVKDAEEVFYMDNGYYTTDLSLLDVHLPANCSAITGGDGGLYSCGDYFILDADGSTVGAATNAGKIIASYCPGANDSWEHCTGARSFTIRFYYAQTGNTANKLICYPLNEAGQQDCKMFGKPLTGAGCNSQSGCTEF